MYAATRPWANGAAIVLLAALSTAAAGGCVLAAETYSAREEKRYAVTGTPDVIATTFDGTIELQGWDRNEVVVEIERRGRTKEAAERLEVNARQDGSRISVDVTRPKGWTGWFGNRAWANLRISVPRSVDLRARTGDGSIRAENFGGRVELRSGDGRIEGTALSGDLNVHTGDGSVRLDRTSGTADLESGDGSITAAGTFGALRVHTGDGSVTVRAEAGTQIGSDWSITTGDGGVTLYLPEGLGAEIDAHTGDGHISTDFPIQVQGRVGGRDLRARLGPGGRQIRVRTGDGSIALRKS